MILPLVDSASMTAWPKNLPNNESLDIYVEIRLEKIVQVSEAVEQSETLTWNEEFPMCVW